MVVENCPYHRDPRVRKEAEALTAAGYRVAVICPGAHGEAPSKPVEKVSVYEFPQWRFSETVPGYLMEYGLGMISIAFLTIWVLMKEGFDIIHVANPPDSMIALLSIYKVVGKKLIYDQHDLSPELYAAKFKASPPIMRCLLALERWSYLLADHVMVTNESYKKVAMERGRLPESKISVLRNGPDIPTPRIIEPDADLRNKAAIIMAFVGVIGRQDGVDCICHALHHLRYKLHRDDFYCVVLGDGDALAATKALAHDLRVNDKIWFVGWISDPEKYYRYIATADICLVPDPWNDYNNRSTFVKIMEYMAAGKPVVGFDLKESRFSAKEGALYAQPNDIADFARKIAFLMDRPELRDSMGRAGAERIENQLAWHFSVPALLNIYTKLVGRDPAQDDYRNTLSLDGISQTGIRENLNPPET